MEISSNLRYIPAESYSHLSVIPSKPPEERIVGEPFQGDDDPVVFVYEVFAKHSDRTSSVFVVPIEGFFDEPVKQREWSGPEFSEWALNHMVVSGYGHLCMHICLAALPRESTPVFIDMARSEDMLFKMLESASEQYVLFVVGHPAPSWLDEKLGLQNTTARPIHKLDLNDDGRYN